ncbi:hypothetical protein [Neisseria yangbaofengii]|uniref:hypothetical protein n=1 Tax=Neisseria yangbaofengii TaxID=2709396 RepID=UPI0013EBE31B|nr:hypothetical protein [Neisseria yangbaofengii]
MSRVSTGWKGQVGVTPSVTKQLKNWIYVPLPAEAKDLVCQEWAMMKTAKRFSLNNV